MKTKKITKKTYKKKYRYKYINNPNSLNNKPPIKI